MQIALESSVSVMAAAPLFAGRADDAILGNLLKTRSQAVRGSFLEVWAQALAYPVFVQLLTELQDFETVSKTPNKLGVLHTLNRAALEVKIV